MLQLAHLREIKIAQGIDRQELCDSLNYWHFAQFMCQAGITSSEFLITKYGQAHEHWIVLVLHFAVFLIRFFQIFVLNTWGGRPWYKTFMPADMETVRYSIHIWNYIVCMVLYVLCCIAAYYM